MHVVVERCEADSIAKDKADAEKVIDETSHFFLMCEQWLRASFDKKEKLLRQFYESNSKNHFPPQLDAPIPSAPFFTFLFCMFVITISLMYNTLFRYVVVFIMIVFVVVSKAFNGFDMLEVTMHGDMVTSRKNK